MNESNDCSKIIFVSAVPILKRLKHSFDICLSMQGLKVCGVHVGSAHKPCSQCDHVWEYFSDLHELAVKGISMHVQLEELRSLHVIENPDSDS